MLHPSVLSDLPANIDELLVSLPEPLKEVTTEVCYLTHDRHEHEKDEWHGRLRVVDQDLLFLRHVREMERESEPMPDEARLHYRDTYKAIDRMRTALHRGTSLEEAELKEQQANDEIDAAGDQKG